MRLLHFPGCQLRARGCNRLMQADQVHQAQNAGEKSVSPSVSREVDTLVAAAHQADLPSGTAFPNSMSASATPLKAKAIPHRAHSALSGRERILRLDPSYPSAPHSQTQTSLGVSMEKADDCAEDLFRGADRYRPAYDASKRSRYE